MRNRKLQRKTERKKNKKVTKISQISPGEGLSKGLKELMQNSGRNSARDSGELRGELRNSGNSDQPFWRTQEGNQVAPPGIPSVERSARMDKGVICRRKICNHKIVSQMVGESDD